MRAVLALITFLAIRLKWDPPIVFPFNTSLKGDRDGTNEEIKCAPVDPRGFTAAVDSRRPVLLLTSSRLSELRRILFAPAIVKIR